MTAENENPNEKKYGRDRRPEAAAALTVIGMCVFIGTWLLSGDDASSLLLNAGYAVGGALAAFAVLYAVTRVFDWWEHRPLDRDFVKKFEDALRDDDARE